MGKTKSQGAENQRFFDLHANWLINRTCNLRCGYCFFSLEERRREDLIGTSLQAEYAVDFFNSSSATWLIWMSGGEPFLHPSFVRLCKELTGSHYIGFDTNLSLDRSYEFADKVDCSRVKSIECSFHVAEIGSELMFETFLERVIYLRGKGFPATVHVVMWPPVFEKSVHFLRMFSDAGIPARPDPFKGTFKGKYYPFAYSELERNIMREYREIFDALLSSADVKPLDLVQRLRPGLAMPGMRKGDVVDGLMSFQGERCYAGQKHIFIDLNGDVKPCHSDKTKLGNIYKKEQVQLFDQANLCSQPACVCHFEGLEFSQGTPRHSPLLTLKESTKKPTPAEIPL